jgi:hypothetical protein
MRVSATCHRCGDTKDQSVFLEDWLKYVRGELGQNIWPDLDPDQREIMRGARAGYFFCPPCFDKIHEGME